MKATVNLPVGVFEIESEDIQDVFEEVGSVYEVLSESECGLCKSQGIHPAVRHVGSGKAAFKYFEWRCRDCGGYLAIGQQEGGKLFPKRKLKEDGSPCKPGEEGRYRNNGWTKFRGGPKEDEAQTEPAPAPAPARQATRR